MTEHSTISALGHQACQDGVSREGLGFKFQDHPSSLQPPRYLLITVNLPCPTLALIEHT